MSPTTESAVTHALVIETDDVASSHDAPESRWRDLASTALSLRAFPCANDLFASLPREAARIGRFERVMLSRVDGSRWTPTVWHELRPRASGAVTHTLRPRELLLQPGSVESDAVRRRVSQIVLDAADDERGCRPLVTIARSRSYVVAPIVAADRTIALLHADHGVDGDATVADQELLRHFAVIAGFALEAAHLADRLGTERRTISDAIVRAQAAIIDPPAPELRLVHEAGATRPVAEAAETTRPWGLSARESSVLELIAAGHSNREVAELLYVSENTVKTHVKHIFRKQDVATRAEAVALAWKRANWDQRRAS